jgi:NAD(P)-dependent dehydrogenase (short-subunit alcohol dehydrogenase family)
MSHQKVILVLGSGANIGRHVARAFTAKGYKVALASRSLKDKESEPGQVHFPIDLSDPASVPNLFSEVTEKLGSPSVVVYNGEYMCLHSTRLCVDMITAAAATANDPEDTFSISLNDFIKDLNINTTSPFAAAKAAVSGFSQLPESASKTFIYTGNVLNTDTTIGPLMSLGVGKSATAHMIHSAATVYADRGFRYVSQRDSSSKMVEDGMADVTQVLLCR